MDDEAVFVSGKPKDFISAIAKHRYWGRMEVVDSIPVQPLKLNTIEKTRLVSGFFDLIEFPSDAQEVVQPQLSIILIKTTDVTNVFETGFYQIAF